MDLIERIFQREGSLYIACNDRNALFIVRNYNLWSCQKVCEALIFLLDNIYIRFGSKLYRQIVGIPMGTNCAPLVADLLLFCYEKDLGLSWFNWWVSFAPEFQCCYFCEPSCLFYFSFNFDFYVSKIMHL